MKQVNTEYQETAQVKKIGVDQTIQKTEVSMGSKIAFYAGYSIIPCLVIGFPFYYINTKNNFIKQQRRINDELASGIDVQLTNRRDTLTKLLEQVKGSMKFEKETLAQITELRSSKVNEDTRVKIDSLVENINKKVNIQMEAYPDLKSTQVVKDLMKASYDIEQDLAASRRLYNAAVSEFNSDINSWPKSVIAASMNLQTMIPFAATAEQRQDVEMKF